MSGAAVGVLAVVGEGAAFVRADRFGGWIRNVLRRCLPGYDVEPNGLAQFIEHYYAKEKAHDRLRLFAAVEGLFDVKWALPRRQASDIEDQERWIVTQFLIGSDFFENYPHGPKVITYHGVPEACGSPFATF